MSPVARRRADPGPAARFSPVPGLATWRRRARLAVALVLAAACVPTQLAGREETSAAASDPGDGGPDWNDWDRAGADAGLSVPDGGAAPDAADAAPEPRPVVLSTAPLEGGGALAVEAREGGYAFVVDATGRASALSVEPLARLSGPETVSVYFGPGCRRVEPGQAAPLGRWTGEILRCATAARPAAVLDGRPAGPGCPVAAAGPGSYALTVWPCGSYGAPLGAVSFDVAALGADPDAER